MIRCNQTFAFRIGAPLLCIASLLAASGCGESGGGGKVPEASPSETLSGVVTTYLAATRDLGRPPKEYSELEAIYAPISATPAEYLTSKRDGEKFVVVWGINLARSAPDTVIAYEKVGVNGKRMLVTLNGEVREVTDAEISKIEAKANR